MSSLHGEIQGLQSQVAVLRSQNRTLVEELDAAKDGLAIKTEQLAARRETVVELERAVADAEEAVVQAHEDAERQQANSRRQIQRLETSIEDLQMEKQAQANALAAAIKSTSAERIQLVEVNSRCQAYKEQVERIYADEGRRRDEVAQLRRESAEAEMLVASLEKQVEGLKEDKERLDIALDSKQQELEMVSDYSPGLTVDQETLRREAIDNTRAVPLQDSPNDNQYPSLHHTRGDSRTFSSTDIVFIHFCTPPPATCILDKVQHVSPGIQEQAQITCSALVTRQFHWEASTFLPEGEIVGSQRVDRR